MEGILKSMDDFNLKTYVSWRQAGEAIFLAFLTGILCVCSSQSEALLTEGENTLTESVFVESGRGIGNEVGSILCELKVMHAEERYRYMEEILSEFAQSGKQSTAEKRITGRNSVEMKERNAKPGAFGREHARKTDEATKKKTETLEIMKDVFLDEKEKSDETEAGEMGSEDRVNETVPEEKPVITNLFELELYGNGGMPEYREDTCERSEFDIAKYEEPEKPGKMFDGWYLDKECSIPFDTVAEEEETVKLYAGWKEFPGFLCNEKGHIIGYTDAGKVVSDHLLVLPTHKSCTGIEKRGVEGLEKEIEEVYVPANIAYIETDLFGNLTNLMYIQVENGNPNYYSRDGRLYYTNGELAASPKGLE